VGDGDERLELAAALDEAPVPLAEEGVGPGCWAAISPRTPLR
jgi:hypothetical protein